jgi:hypothetical protein
VGRPRHGAEDRDYIREHTVGWDAFRERILEYPPDRVAAITGLDVERIVALGRRSRRRADRDPRHDGHPAPRRRRDGGAHARAMPGRDRRLGRYGGGDVVLDERLLRGNLAALRRDDLLRAAGALARDDRLGEGLLEVDGPAGQGARRLRREPRRAARPTQSKVRRGLEREDLFTVVMEQFPTDTVDYADIVLPATMQTEHLDVTTATGTCTCTSTAGRRRRRATACRRPRRSARSPPHGADGAAPVRLRRAAARRVCSATLAGGHRRERLRRDGWMRLNYPRRSSRSPTASTRRRASSSSSRSRAPADGHDRSRPTRHRSARPTATAGSR